MDGTALIVRGRTAEDVLKLLRGDRLIALAIAIADGSARSDIEISAYRESLHPAEYDLTRPADDKEDVQVAQRAARYIRERGDVWPWRMVEVDGNPNLVRFVERDSKTDDDGMCYCQEGVVCPACEAPAKPRPDPFTDLRAEVNALRFHRDIGGGFRAGANSAIDTVLLLIDKHAWKWRDA